MFNCSSALSILGRGQGFKEQEERERNEEGGREVSSRDESKQEERSREVWSSGEERKGMCLIVLEADGQTVRQTLSQS